MNDQHTHTPTILQVLPALNSGGVERGTIDIAKAIADQGWRSLVASAGGTMEHQVHNAKAEHITLPLDTKNFFQIRKNAKLLQQIIEEYKVDLVHVRSRAPAWSVYLALKNNPSIPFITTFHGTYGLNGIGKRWYNSVMTTGKKVIAVSQFITNHIQTYYNIANHKIVTIPRGVDTDYFNAENVSSNRVFQVMERLNIPEELPVILMPGRITEWKGQLSLIEALKEIPHRQFYCLIMGDSSEHPSYKAKLDQAIIHHKLHANIRIMPNSLDMPAAYKVSDMVVSASIRPEAFGRIAPEAQSMERLIVATDHGGSEETVIHSETGWLIPPGDSKAMAKAIDHGLSLSKEQRSSMTKKARQHIIDNFSLKQMCHRTINLYEDIIQSSLNPFQDKNIHIPRADQMNNSNDMATAEL